MCGKLFCENGKADPNYGRLVTLGKCKATFYGERENDFGQVDTGTKCGDGKVNSPASQPEEQWVLNKNLMFKSSSKS